MYINFEDVDGELRPVDERPNHEPLKQIGYAWEISGKLMKMVEKLRQDDIANLTYPYEELDDGAVGVIENQDITTYSTQVLIVLKKSVKYTVTLTVKGDDSEGCIITAQKQEKITFP